MNKIKNLRDSIAILKQRTKELLKEIHAKNFNDEDFILIQDVLDKINNCFRSRMEKYLSEHKRYLQFLDKQEDRQRHDSDFRQPLNENEIKEPKIPKMGDCIKDVKHNFPINAPINFFPSSKPGHCQPQCIVLSSGDWDFNDTVLRRDITNYWFRCFYKNNFTLVLTQ